MVARVSPICTKIPAARASSLTDILQPIALAMAVIAAVSSSEFMLYSVSARQWVSENPKLGCYECEKDEESTD